MGASLTALLGYDVTDPRSPHSVHVASEADVPSTPPWGRAVLGRAVRLADGRDEVVVLDHGRERLYLAPTEGLDYRPPGTLGLGDPPALVVDGPVVVVPEEDGLGVRAFDRDLVEGPPPDWPGKAGDAAALAGEDTNRPATADDRRAGTGAERESRTETESETTGPEDAPDGAGATSVTVSPTFDVLVPAFDIEEQGTPTEPVERHAVETPSGVESPTPSG